MKQLSESEKYDEELLYKRLGKAYEIVNDFTLSIRTQKERLRTLKFSPDEINMLVDYTPAELKEIHIKRAETRKLNKIKQTESELKAKIERRKAQMKAWRDKNKDKIKEYNRKYRKFKRSYNVFSDSKITIL